MATIAGSDCCRHPKTKTERLEATASLLSAEEISVDAAVDAFLAQRGDIFTIKEEQKTAQKLLCERMFLLHPSCFSLVSVAATHTMNRFYFLASVSA